MICIYFKVIKSGKTSIEGKELNLLRLLEDKHYLVDDQLLKIISNYFGQNLQNQTAYKVVGWTAKKDKGIAAKIEKTNLERAVKEIRKYEYIEINPQPKL